MDDTYFDITRKIQEFGFGPSDSESEEDEIDPPFDWESIGLLPALQKIQINLRNASYSFMTGLRRSIEEYEVQHVVEQAGSLKIQEEKKAAAADAGQETEAEIVVQSDKHEAHEDDDDGDEDEDDEEDDEEDDDEEDIEWDEVGRLPKLNQLQMSLRQAQTAFNLQIESLPSSNWQTLMPTFQFPSFFEGHEHVEADDVDINDPAYADVFSEAGITDEDRSMCYNEEGLTGCQHYLRNCKSECSKCHKFYMCQLCHDEVEDHRMNRQLTRRMLCLNCKKPQPPRRSCRFCHEVMGDYYCSICKLWNDDPDKSIYHCDKCGICRVGSGPGIDVFHCDKCGICLSLVVENNHRCLEEVARSNCPICLEDLFSSTAPTVFMPCGHAIHRECFEEYSKRYYRCPVCSKSILNTSALFRMIDEEVQYEVLPPELADKLVNIVCHDCHLKSQTKFHLAGFKCETCGSYNTALL